MESEVLTDRAKSILADAGIRETATRILVLREILECDCAFTLADMEERILTLDKSTLCRNLNVFLKHHILHEVDNDNGCKMYCRCSCGTKHGLSQIHFTCLSCRKTFCIRGLIADFDSIALPPLDGYDVMEVNYVLKGLCPNCKQKE